MTAHEINLITCQRASKKFVNSVLLKLVYRPLNWLASLSETPVNTVLRRSESWGLRETTLSLRTGETIGVVGHIGSGKSTLVRILAGQLKPDLGKLVRTGEVLFPSWDAAQSINKCEDGADYEKFIQCLYDAISIEKHDQDRTLAAIAVFQVIFEKEFGTNLGRLEATPSQISRVFYRYLFECFFDVLVLDNFMSDLQVQEQFLLKEDWRKLDLTKGGRVLVFNNTANVPSFCDRLIVMQNQQIVHDGATAAGLEMFDSIFRARPDEARKYCPEVSTSLEPATTQKFRIMGAGFLNQGKTVHLARDHDTLDFYIDFQLANRVDSFQIKIEMLDTGTRRRYPIAFTKHNELAPLSLTKGSYRFSVKLDAGWLPAGLISPVINLMADESLRIHEFSAAIRILKELPANDFEEMACLNRPAIYPGFTYLSNTEPFRELRPGSLCVDCGANVGDVTQLMLMYGCKVIAFEPNPVAFAELSGRFEGEANVTCIPKGVFDQNTKLELYFPNDVDVDPLRSSVSATIYSDKQNIAADKFEVIDVVDISEVIDSLSEPVALLKIDIEGAEYAVLNRLLETGKIFEIGKIVVEEHYDKIESLRKERDRLMEKFLDKSVNNVLLDWM